VNSSAFKPEDYGVPTHFRHWTGDNCEDHTGPFFFNVVDEKKVETAFRIKAQNCNGHKSVHGGVLMTFADYTLCITALGGGNGAEESVVTVSCNNEFIGPAFEGDLVTAYGEIIRKGGSLIFLRAVLEVNGQPVLTSSGVVKRIRRPV
jgi:uncharacterized protein (TIGR00369 family)